MKINMNRLGLKWKIFVFLLGFCTLLLVVLWLFQTVFLDWFYKNIKLIEIRNSTRTIINHIEDESLPELIKSISRSSDICISIISEDGTILHTEDVLRECAIHKLMRQDILRIISAAEARNGELFEYLTLTPPPRPGRNDKFEQYFMFNANTEVMSLIHVTLTQNDSGETIAVFVNSIISPISATVTTLRYQLYVITGIMLILSVLLAIIIAKRVSKPIEEINKSAKTLANGTYDTRFNGKGFLEIKELSDTLNTAAAELSKVEALRRELMANISHDLRTPLSLVYSYAEIMHDFPDEITSEQTQIIMSEIRWLSSLVNDIFDISQLESGIQQLNISEFNITQCIESTTNHIAELIKKDGYNVSFIYDREVTIFADKVKIKQAFYNLLTNAINYTGKDKFIEVRQISLYNGVKISVTDTGEGISTENLPYIWDRYYKVDKKHVRALTGTGLGLSIVKKVIEMHNGEYGVDSQVGKGSTFWFIL